MAQFGRVPEWGSGGRWFESSHSDQNKAAGDSLRLLIYLIKENRYPLSMLPLKACLFSFISLFYLQFPLIQILAAARIVALTVTPISAAAAHFNISHGINGIAVTAAACITLVPLCRLYQNVPVT